MGKDYQRHGDDQTLIEAFNNRHRAALKEIFYRQWKKQVFVARGLGLIKEDAEDVVQNALLSVFVDEDLQFSSIAHIDRTLYKMVYWRCLDLVRDKGVTNRRMGMITNSIDTVDLNNIEVRVCQAEILAQLSREIEKLAPRQRRVVELVKEGYSSGEVSEVMRISRRAVNSYLQAAIARLRSRIMDKL